MMKDVRKEMEDVKKEMLKKSPNDTLRADALTLANIHTDNNKLQGMLENLQAASIAGRFAEQADFVSLAGSGGRSSVASPIGNLAVMDTQEMQRLIGLLVPLGNSLRFQMTNEKGVTERIAQKAGLQLADDDPKSPPRIKVNAPQHDVSTGGRKC